MRVRCQKKTLQKVSKIKYVEFYKKLVRNLERQELTAIEYNSIFNRQELVHCTEASFLRQKCALDYAT